MEVGREDRGLHARIGIPLVGREKRGDVIQLVNSARGVWDDRILDFSGLFWDIRGGGDGWGRITYDGLEYVVNRGGIAAEDEPCHVDYALPFTCKCNARCEGEEEEQSDDGKHGSW